MVTAEQRKDAPLAASCTWKRSEKRVLLEPGQLHSCFTHLSQEAMLWASPQVASFMQTTKNNPAVNLHLTEDVHFEGKNI